MLGKRRGHGTHELNYRPHNVTQIVIGTVFLWVSLSAPITSRVHAFERTNINDAQVGWFGFNAGSALSANLRAIMAAVVTNLAASVGGLTWCIMDYRLERKWSTVGFCSGVIAGLVAITPGSGFVPAWAAVVYGVVGGGLCNLATKIKFLLHIDDSLDIFAIHGIGGLVGDLLTGLFAADYIIALDGVSIGESAAAGGWINHHWIQLAYQLADGVTGMAYTFVVSAALLYIINWIPGLKLRATEDEELMGMDETDIGEFAYDYVELTRDVVHGIEDQEVASFGHKRNSSDLDQEK
jgi:ammonium transporter, Amt family